MDSLIQILIMFNILLSTALFVVKLSELDRRHSARIAQEERRKTPRRRDTDQ